MKKFISKNWKNIFISIGVIFIVINLLFKIISPATIPQDFLEYGPNIESDIFDSANDISNGITKIEDSGDIVNNVSNSTGLPSNLAKGIVVFAFGFILILIISNLTEGSSGSGGKKKK